MCVKSCQHSTLVIKHALKLAVEACSWQLIAESGGQHQSSKNEMKTSTRGGRDGSAGKSACSSLTKTKVQIPAQHPHCELGFLQTCDSSSERLNTPSGLHAHTGMCTYTHIHTYVHILSLLSLTTPHQKRKKERALLKSLKPHQDIKI